MKNSFDVLIVGLGKIGLEYDLYHNKNKFILSHANAFFSHKDFNLVGAVDIDKEKTKEFKNYYNKNIFIDIKDALKKTKPDIIIISTPTRTLTEVFDAITNIYCPKVILIEKPISTDLKEAQRIVKNAQNKNIKLFVNYMRRSEPNSNIIKERIEKVRLPFKGVVWYSKGIYNGASHFINLLEYWFGECNNSKIYSKGGFFQKNDPEPEFEIEFKKGKFIFLPLESSLYFHNSIDMYCDKYRMRYENSGKQIFFHTLQKDKVFTSYNILSINATELKTDFSKIQANVVDNLSNFFKGKTYNLCSGFDGLKTLKVIDKIRKQIK